MDMEATEFDESMLAGRSVRRRFTEGEKQRSYTWKSLEFAIESMIDENIHIYNAVTNDR